MKRAFALLLAGLLMLSMAACTSEPAESSSPPEENSSVSSQPEEGSSSTLEVVGEEKQDAEDENVSKLNTSSEASTPETSSVSSQPPVEVTPPAEQQPAESKPEPKPEKETPVTPPIKVEPEPEAGPEPVQQQTPPAQTQQPPTSAASAQDDGEWTQEKVDDVVEAYRTAALKRGWTEDTDLNVALTTGGAWGNPINTSWAIYENEMRSDWIEEYLYGREFDVGKEPEDMYFHVVSEDHGGYWEIYYIFASNM